MVGQLQDEQGCIVGAEVQDVLSGKKMQVYAKQVINATGPFTDGLRQMSDPSKPSIIMPSAGWLLLRPPCHPCGLQISCTSLHVATNIWAAY